MAKLQELQAFLSAPGGRYQTLTFLCPRCKRHQLQIDIWHGTHGDFEVPLEGMPDGRVFRAMKRLWHAEQGEDRGWDTLTITPSIDRTGMDPCGGWHGNITNGIAN